MSVSILNKNLESQTSRIIHKIMKVVASSYLLLAFTIWGVKSIGTIEPDGTLDPTIPSGLYTADGEINDPTIANPAPEFPAPPDGTPNISSKSI